MDRTEFLEILRSQLAGQMHEGKVAAHVRYYEDYIQSQVRQGHSEAEVLAQLGDPRLIAKTLLDTDMDSGQETYEEEAYSGGGAYSQSESTQDSVQRRTRRLDLSTWYGKAIVIVAAVIAIMALVTIIGAVLPFFIILGIILFVISRLRRM